MKKNIVQGKNIKYILFLLLLLSCNKEKPQLIPKEKFVLILTDIYVAEALISATNFPKAVNYDTIIFHDFIYKKYGYNKKDFDSTLSYYSHRLNEMAGIYDEVVEKLKLGSSAIKDTISENDTIKAIDIWSEKKNWNLPIDGDIETIEFSIPLQGTGKYTFNFDLKIYEDDESENPRLIAYFFKEDTLRRYGKRIYFANMPFERSEEFQAITIHNLLTDSTFTHLKGELLDHTNAANDRWKKHIEVKNIVLNFEPAPIKK